MMKDLKTKVLNIHFIPVLILLIAAVYLFISSFLIGSVFSYKNYFAFIGLLVIIVLIIKTSLKISVLALGLFLLLGWVGLVNYSPNNTSFYIGFWLFGYFIPIVNAQPLMMFTAILHFILSKDFYFGIISKKYWKNFKTN